MAHYIDPHTLGQIVLALLITVQTITQWLSSKSRRRAEREDRERERRELLESQEQTANALAQLTAARAEQLAEKVEEVHVAIKENTVVNELALNSANNFNEKFAKALEGEKMGIGHAEIQVIRRTGDDTNERVRNVEETLQERRG